MQGTDMKQIIFETIHGSHLYGLAHAGSDVRNHPELDFQKSGGCPLRDYHGALMVDNRTDVWQTEATQSTDGSDMGSVYVERDNEGQVLWYEVTVSGERVTFDAYEYDLTYARTRGRIWENSSDDEPYREPMIAAWSAFADYIEANPQED